MRRKLLPILLLLVALVVFGCQLATVRTLEEDRRAKEGFNPDRYVEDIWEDELIPTFREDAVAINTLLEALEADRQAAIERYSRSSSIGDVSTSYSFMTYGTGRVVTVEHTDLGNDVLYGNMMVDLEPYDGEGDVEIAIGDRFSQRNTAVRDAVGFIDFNDFVNQTEFASVSRAIKNRILTDVIGMLELSELQGQTITFYGAFTISGSAGFGGIGPVEILPVIIEVQTNDE